MLSYNYRALPIEFRNVAVPVNYGMLSYCTYQQSMYCAKVAVPVNYGMLSYKDLIFLYLLYD